VDLNGRLFLRLEEMVRFYLHDGDTSGRQRFGFCRIEFVADTHVDGARNHGYVLNCRVPVRRDLVVSRES
jgi:hypothetical protein